MQRETVSHNYLPFFELRFPENEAREEKTKGLQGFQIMAACQGCIDFCTYQTTAKEIFDSNYELVVEQGRSINIVNSEGWFTEIASR